MSIFCHIEKALADCQTAFLNRAVEVEQGFAQLIDLRQVGQMRAMTEGGQLVEQRAQFLAFAGVLPPAPQQVFRIQHDVHAFGQKTGEQRGVALDTQAAVRLTQHHGEAVVEHRQGSLDQRRGARNIGQRRAVQLFEALVQQRFGAAQQDELR